MTVQPEWGVWEWRDCNHDTFTKYRVEMRTWTEGDRQYGTAYPVCPTCGTRVWLHGKPRRITYGSV